MFLEQVYIAMFKSPSKTFDKHQKHNFPRSYSTNLILN